MSTASTEIVPPVLTVKEVKALLRVSNNTVLRLFQKGELRGFRAGDAVRIFAQSVSDFVNQTANLAAKPVPPEVPVLPRRRKRPAAVSGRRFLSGL